MKRLILFIVVVFFFSNCTDDDKFRSVNIRLSNISNFDYKNIIVNTSTGNVAYGDLNSDKVTEYKTFELAYHYAFIELFINDERFAIQPVDYVGETPLKNGNYTYELDINGNALTLRFIKD
jgi:hypothetical protein